MADGFVQVAVDGVGKKIDNSELTVGTNLVERQRVNIADPTVAANIATVSAAGAVKVDGSAVSQPVTIGDVTATGALVAVAQAVTLTVSGYGLLGIQITGTWVGTLVFEYTVDGANWQAAWVDSVVSQSIVQSVTANDVVKAQGGGLSQFRVRMSAWTSGSASVTIRGSQSGGPRRIWPAKASAAAPTLTEGQPAQESLDLSGNLRVLDTQGTASAQTAAGWPVQPWGMTDSVFASGLVSAPAAGAAIATIASASLPAGTYRVDFQCGMVAATATVASADTGNMELRKGAAAQLSSLGGSSGVEPAVAAVGVTMDPSVFPSFRVTLDGTTTLSINATAAGSLSVKYIAQIIATRIF